MIIGFNFRIVSFTLLWFFAVICQSALAKTSVTVEGTTVVIHVPIEVEGFLGRKIIDQDTGESFDASTYIKAKVEEIWKNAFGGFKWGNCLTFRVDLQIIPLALGAPRQAGNHHIKLNSKSKNSYWNETGPDDRVPDRDFPFAYTRDMTGEWNTPAPDIIAHEVGHALGLGDDYFRTPTDASSGRKPTGEMFPGLDAPFSEDDWTGFPGTFTTSGRGGPTPDALARVILQMKDAGVLPQCWKGTMQAEDVAQHGPDQRCEDSWAIDLTIVVSATGSLSGEANGRRASPVKCTHQFPTSWAEGGFFHLEGQGDKQALRVKFLYDRSDPAGSIDNGLFALLVGLGTPKTVDIPIVGKNEAYGSTSFAWTAGSSVRNGSGQTTLKCTTC